jgi:hypothetical protein
MGTKVKTKKSIVLVLRTCNADMTSHGGFKWPKEGAVRCRDWSPEPVCGGGLHGLLWGEGGGTYLSWEPGAKWLVVEVDQNDVVTIGDKVKFPSGVVVYCGDRESATTYLREHGADGKAIVGGTATAGEGGTATAGDRGTATAGEGGTATAGHEGTATAGEGGTATAGHGGTATAGEGGSLVVKFWDGVRYRIAAADVGENGIEPNVPYRVKNGKLVKVHRGAA